MRCGSFEGALLAHRRDRCLHPLLRALPPQSGVPLQRHPSGSSFSRLPHALLFPARRKVPETIPICEDVLAPIPARGRLAPTFFQDAQVVEGSFTFTLPAFVERDAECDERLIRCRSPLAWAGVSRPFRRASVMARRAKSVR